MLFKINSHIFKRFPGARVGVIVAHDINNSTKTEVVAKRLKQAQEKLKRGLTLEQLKSHPHIEVWRDAYRSFGAKPSEYLSSVENLARRVLKGTSLRAINTLVDLYNAASLEYMLPAGGEDLDTIKGDIELTFAGSNEKPVVLLGDPQAKTPEEGEVFYKDDNGAICRRWNWREAERTRLTPDTRNAILVLEALPPVTDDVLKHAVNTLAQLIEMYAGGRVTVSILDEQHNQVTIRHGDAYIPLNRWQEVSDAPSVYQSAACKDESTQEPQELAASQEHLVRVEKVAKMRAMGTEPWPAFKPINALCQDVIDEFQEQEHEKRCYQIAGRVVSLRYHGKTLFAHLQDRSGKLQIYLKQDALGKDRFEWWQHFIDVGDIVWCSGTSFVTKMGEVTLDVEQFTLLSKCLYPLPEKFHGLADIETRYRQRYLDLISSQESRARFKKRSCIVRTMREFLDDFEFMEVETPMLHPIPGGAAAKPFVTHHNALDTDLYLRIAPELYLKRLVVGGLERVYEINRNFRNEGISTRHNPEFTMLELYAAHQDYVFAMNLVEEMFRRIAMQANGSMRMPFGDVELDFEQPFARLSMKDAVIKYTHCKPEEVEEQSIDSLMVCCKVKLAVKGASWGQKLLAIFEEIVEPQLIQPTFITHFPVEVSPLAKRNAQNPAFVDRFELFICGMELSNSFNELNDPFDQAARFHEQATARASGDDEAHYYDAEFIQALEYGLPPTVGVGIGIDRLTMLITNARSIKDVILFPTLKRK